MTPHGLTLPPLTPSNASEAPEPTSPPNGAEMTTEDKTCWKWKGDAAHYQEQAAMAAIEEGVTVMPWCWIEPSCGTKYCMEPTHLSVHAPAKIAYPYGICIYCGRAGWTRDHLLPTEATGRALRKHVLTVPACGECNSFISDRYATSITERRAIAKAGIRKKYRRKLYVHEFTEDELAEFGPGLRPTILRARSDRQAVIDRLEFPEDPTFDLRYLGMSGIDDPYALGLLKSGHAA